MKKNYVMLKPSVGLYDDGVKSSWFGLFQTILRKAHGFDDLNNLLYVNVIVLLAWRHLSIFDTKFVIF